MKRLLVAITALIAALAIGLATVSTTAGAAGGNHTAQVAKKKKKKKKKVFPSGISFNVVVTPATTYSPGSGTFSGQVTSSKSACVSGRTVIIARNGAQVLTTTTAADGTYSVTVNSAPASGSYTASTPKKVIVKKGKKNKKTGKRKKKKIICGAAVSPPVNVA